MRTPDLLVAAYEGALLKELEAIGIVAEAQSHAEYAKLHVLISTTIDGKNAGARKKQESQALDESETYGDALANVAQAEHDKALASIDVRCLDVEIGLTKAWYYSQSGN